LISANQNPEQLARDKIDKLLLASGWLIQNKSSVNLSAAKVLPSANIKPMLDLPIISSS